VICCMSVFSARAKAAGQGTTARDVPTLLADGRDDAAKRGGSSASSARASIAVKVPLLPFFCVAAAMQHELALLEGEAAGEGLADGLAPGTAQGG